MLVKKDIENRNTQEYYSEHFKTHDPGAHNMTFLSVYKQFNNVLNEVLLTDGLIMDMGGGAGGFIEAVYGYSLRYLQLERPPTLINMDFSEGAMSLFYKKGRDNFSKFYLSDLNTEQELYRGAVDLAFCFQTLEHVEDIRAAAKTLWEMVKVNGYLVGSLPAENCDCGSHLWRMDLIGVVSLWTGLTLNPITIFPRFDYGGKEINKIYFMIHKKQ